MNNLYFVHSGNQAKLFPGNVVMGKFLHLQPLHFSCRFRHCGQHLQQVDLSERQLWAQTLLRFHDVSIDSVPE